LNPFGTSEVSITIENESVFSDNNNKTKRVIIEIPGESNPDEARKKIGKLPTMEFKILKPDSRNEYRALQAQNENNPELFGEKF
jgi:preprotein translocase subunit SecD